MYFLLIIFKNLIKESIKITNFIFFYPKIFYEFIIISIIFNKLNGTDFERY